ncbi:MAG: hypothetical protein JWM21_3432 [Acidobacteria bacterium]|nr:hypothetical protein [Acidobacteriota bacterium]
MFKKLLSLVLAVLLLNVIGVKIASAASKEEKQARFAEKVKEGIHRLGVGEAARVEVTLRDKTKLKGYISEVGADNFVVVDAKRGEAATVAYPQVKQIKGNNLSTGAKIAIGIGIGVGITILVLLLIIGHEGCCG